MYSFVYLFSVTSVVSSKVHMHETRASLCWQLRDLWYTFMNHIKCICIITINIFHSDSWYWYIASRIFFAFLLCCTASLIVRQALGAFKITPVFVVYTRTSILHCHCGHFWDLGDWKILHNYFILNKIAYLAFGLE